MLSRSFPLSLCTGYRQQMDAAGFVKGSDEMGAFMHDLSAVMPAGISRKASAFDAMMMHYNRMLLSEVRW